MTVNLSLIVGHIRKIGKVPFREGGRGGGEGVHAVDMWALDVKELRGSKSAMKH